MRIYYEEELCKSFMYFISLASQVMIFNLFFWFMRFKIWNNNEWIIGAGIERFRKVLFYFLEGKEICMSFLKLSWRN